MHKSIRFLKESEIVPRAAAFSPYSRKSQTLRDISEPIYYKMGRRVCIFLGCLNSFSSF